MANIVPLTLLGGFRLLPLSLLLKQPQKLKAEFQEENEKPCARVQPGGKADDGKLDKF
jgi:hypothetical protein